MNLSSKTAHDISKMEPFTQKEAEAFFNDRSYEGLSDKQNAALALTQPRKIMPEEISVPAINRHLPFNQHVGSDVLWGAQDKSAILEKVTGYRSASLPTVPDDIKLLSEFSPKKLAELPSLTEKQAMDFYKGKVWEQMDQQQIAVMALSQPRRIIPEQKFVDAINTFLPKQDKVGWDVVVYAADEKRNLIDTLVRGNAPQENAVIEMSKRITSFMGITKPNNPAKKDDAALKI